jgi:excisionase family DNA binding protein
MIKAQFRENGSQADTSLLTEGQAAAYLNIQRRTLRLWRRHRGLPFLALTAKSIRIRQADLEKWLLQHRVALGS